MAFLCLVKGLESSEPLPIGCQGHFSSHTYQKCLQTLYQSEMPPVLTQQAMWKKNDSLWRDTTSVLVTKKK